MACFSSNTCSLQALLAFPSSSTTLKPDYKPLILSSHSLPPPLNKKEDDNQKKKKKTDTTHHFSSSLPETSCSVTFPAPIFTPKPYLPANMIAVVAFVSPVLAILVLLLKLGPKRSVLSSRRTITTRNRFGENRLNVFGRKFHSEVLFVSIGTSSASIRDAYDEPMVLKSGLWLGFCKMMSSSSYPLIHRSSVKMEVPLLESGTDPQPNSSSNLCDSQFDFSSEEKGIVTEIDHELPEFSDGEDDFDRLMLETSSCSDQFLTIASDASLEIPSLRMVSSIDQDPFNNEGVLQAVIPAIAIGAGSLGVITGGVVGGLQMVGFVAITSFIVNDLLWASNRRKLWEDVVQVTDREKLISLLKSRNTMMN